MLPTESLILTTGLPGAGKTLYAVHLAKQYAEEGTRVFSWGLDGANEELFEVLPADWSFSDWTKLPQGSVVIFDEAHKLLPVRTAGAPPKPIQDLTEIRHYGLRFIFITQDPRNLDVFVRRLIGRHFHLRRKMGFDGAIVRNFDFCAEDPMDFHAQKTSTSELWKYPKDLYGLYKSASLHVVKPKIPKKVMFFGLLFLLCFSFVAYTFFSYSSRISKGEILQEVKPSGDALSSPSSLSASALPLDTLEQYIAHTTPLTPVAPWTAPVYRDLLIPPALPGKPVCYIGSRGCRCFTDQMTRLQLPEPVCESLVRDGIYSPYHAAYSQPDSQGAQGGGQAASQPPTAYTPPPPPVVLIPDQGVETATP